MKRTNKILILLLSLVLMIGAFAVMASAEEAQVATVVYPDGSTVSVAVGTQIDPKPFTDGLYHGEGNTLFKDDATEGWPDCQAKCNTFFKYSFGERKPRHLRGRLLISETTAFSCS